MAAVALAVAPPRGRARPGEHVTGPVQDLAVVKVEQLGCRRAGPGMQVERAHERAQTARIELDVVVEQHHQLGVGFADARIQRRRHAHVFAQREQPHLGPAIAKPVRRAVAGGVVDDQHCEVAKALSGERRQRGFEQVAPVVARYGHRHTGPMLADGGQPLLDHAVAP